MKNFTLLLILLAANFKSYGQFCTNNITSLMNGPNCCNFAAVTMQDMNNDGMKDVVYTAYAGYVSVALAVGNGSFAPDVAYTPINGWNSSSGVVGDFNSDGHKDVLATNGFNPLQQLFLGSASGTLSAPIGYTLNFNQQILGANEETDFNSDGITDFYIRNVNAITAYTCDGAAGFSSVTLITASSSLSASHFEDMNKDNKRDFVLFREFSNHTEIDVYFGNGTTTFTLASTYTVPVSSNLGNLGGRHRFGDYNNDGHKDIAWSNPSNGNLFVVCGNALGVFGSDYTLALGFIVNQNFYCVDTDGDFYNDLYTYNVQFGILKIYQGSPSGTFAMTYSTTSFGSEHSHFFLDLNNDGKKDFLGIADNYIMGRLNQNAKFTHNATSICSGNSATLSATGATAYTWSNGSNSPTIVVSPTISTLYTLSTINSSACANNLTYSLIVNPKPVLSLASGTVCKGQTFTLQPSGAATMAISGNNYIVTPTATSVYTLTGLTNGCYATPIAATVGVIPVPTVAVTMTQTFVCVGNTVQLQASGATNYTWSSGSNNAQISVSPTTSTIYTVTGQTSGCSSTKTATLGIGNHKNISGTVSSGTNAVSGSVQLFQKYSGKVKWDSISTTNIVGNSYSFNNMPPGAYVVRALPTQPNLAETYGPSSTGFKLSTTISHYCLANAVQNISVIALPSVTTTSGSGLLCGHVYKGTGFGQKGSSSAGNPVKGTTVKGGKNPGGTTVGRTITNASGEYTLSGLPANAPGESYFIFVDIPGIDTNGTYHRVLITGIETFTDLDFEVDSVKSTPLGPKTNVGMEKLSVKKSTISFFPNPTNEKINFQFNLEQNSEITIDLLNIKGQLVKHLLLPTPCDKGPLMLIAGISDVPVGMYFVKFNINGDELFQKIIVAD